MVPTPTLPAVLSCTTQRQCWFMNQFYCRRLTSLLALIFLLLFSASYRCVKFTFCSQYCKINNDHQPRVFIPHLMTLFTQNNTFANEMRDCFRNKKRKSLSILFFFHNIYAYKQRNGRRKTDKHYTPQDLQTNNRS